MELLYTILTYLGGYSLGPSLASIQTYGPWVPLWSNGIEVAAVMAVCLLIGITYLRSLRSLLSSKGAALFLLDLAMVGGYAAVSAFPYNVRYALPALLGFLAMVADIFARASRSSLARCALGGLFALSLLADWQWYYSPAYRKEDSRAVAKWLIENEDRIKSWTIVPGYSAEPVQWYLEALGHPETNSWL